MANEQDPSDKKNLPITSQQVGKIRLVSLPASQRRRRELRYALRAPIRVKCDSWTSVHDLVLGNVSANGMFIATTEVAQVGDTVAVTVLLPDLEQVELSAVVRHVLEGQGLGVEITEGEGEARVRFRALVERVERAVTTRPSEVDIFEIDVADGPGAQLDGDGDSVVVPVFVESDEPSEAAADLGQVAQEGKQEARRVLMWTSPREPVVAMDFGTSRSSVAIVLGTEVKVLKVGDGDWQIPSIVGFEESGLVVGEEAVELLGHDPTRVITSPKRLLGRRFDDPEVASYLGSLPMPASQGADGEVVLHPAGQELSTSQVCAALIERLKRAASDQLGVAVERAVMTVPVSYDEHRCNALRKAAALAGITVVELIEEPTAAALAQRADPNCRGLVAVYDFGGGTFDFSVVDVSAADYQVVATAGDTWLGGDDLDSALGGAVADAFWRTKKIELRNKLVEWQRLLLACERAKRELSLSSSTAIHVENVALTAEGPIGLETEVTRESFAALAASVIQRSIETCSEALELSGLTPQELSAIYLSGGTTYVRAVRDAVAAYFGGTPRAFVAPERAVVIGAALYTADLTNSGAPSMVAALPPRRTPPPLPQVPVRNKLPPSTLPTGQALAAIPTGPALAAIPTGPALAAIPTGPALPALPPLSPLTPVPGLPRVPSATAIPAAPAAPVPPVAKAPEAPPSAESDAERRGTLRRALEAEITFFGQHNFYLGFSQNISHGGVFIATYEALRIGEEIEVRFLLPGTAQHLTALCTVQWLREYNPSTPQVEPGAGCKFARISANALAAIDAYIQHRDPLFYDDD